MSKSLEITRVFCYNKGMKNKVMTGDFDAQSKRIAELENTVAELSALVKHFEELFKLSQLKRFCASSEKTATESGQVTLFGEPEVPVIIPSPQPEEPAQKSHKQKGKRQEDLSKLPLEIVEHDIPESERKCPQCNGSVEEIGVGTRDELKIIPAKVIRVQHRCKAYKCQTCAETSDKTPIIKAEMPTPLIKSSVASPSAVAYIMTQKHLMHLPFYRLEQDFMRQGVFINRQNMANWSIQVCEDWLGLVYDKLRRNLLRHNVLHADETSLQVLREPGKSAQQKSYMWLYRTSGDAEKPTVLYEYQPDRGGEHPETFLSGWRGFCHTDGYSAYQGLSGVKTVGCWAHVRRRFDEAFKIAKAPDSPAKVGLDYCNQLFALERKFAGLPPSKRFEQRMEQSKPVVEAFFSWAKSMNMPPKLAITRALGYVLKQEKWLMNVFLDGRLELSNNRAERSIKPFVIGRKSWLFASSVSGAKASAIAFSIIETARENGLKPFEYLSFLLDALPKATSGQIEELLPWGSRVPGRCKL